MFHTFITRYQSKMQRCSIDLSDYVYIIDKDTNSTGCLGKIPDIEIFRYSGIENAYVGHIIESTVGNEEYTVIEKAGIGACAYLNSNPNCVRNLADFSFEITGHIAIRNCFPLLPKFTDGQIKTLLKDMGVSSVDSLRAGGILLFNQRLKVAAKAIYGDTYECSSNS